MLWFGVRTSLPPPRQFLLTLIGIRLQTRYTVCRYESAEDDRCTLSSEAIYRWPLHLPASDDRAKGAVALVFGVRPAWLARNSEVELGA